MSASWADNMRGPRVKTPLLLLLLLLTSLTGTVLCEGEDGEEDGTLAPEAAEEQPSESSPTSSTSPLDTSLEPGDDITDDDGSGNNPAESPTDETNLSSSTASPVEEESLDPIIIMIPVVLVVVIIAIIVVCICIKRRWNQKTGSQDLTRDDPYLDDASAEKVPMPMFEEDVPSVLELEMEELDQWMKKDGETAGDSKQA